MQNDDFLDKDSFYSEGGFQITNRAKGFLATTAFWGKVVAIVGFISSVLMLLAGIVLAFSGSLLSQFGAGFDALGAAGGILIAFVYVIGALFYFVPSLYLFHFSNKTQAAIRSSDSLVLEKAFENLKSLYKFMGITVFVIIGFYILFFIIGLFGSAMM
ncbi:hypothetical protein ACE193_04270 [Bernardetia sp. OM2101]|uniref:hypothetical protein n=1 Tax=Bernardetia sp. OM2101 TaxID=3344876 RepID=UPI0035CF7A7B